MNTIQVRILPEVDTTTVGTIICQVARDGDGILHEAFANMRYEAPGLDVLLYYFQLVAESEAERQLIAKIGGAIILAIQSQLETERLGSEIRST